MYAKLVHAILICYGGGKKERRWRKEEGRGRRISRTGGELA